MLPENKWIQFGLPNSKIKGIVIHNTNNHFMGAEELAQWLEKESKHSGGCHYLVDYKETIQVLPDDWSCYNVGNGLAFGNTDCIAIEICSNLNTELYFKGQERAIELIKKLMKKYHLTTDDIFFHRDFQHDINCPAQILKIYGSKANFVSLLKEE